MNTTQTDTAAQPASEFSRQNAPWLTFYESGVPHTQSYPEIPLFFWLDEAADKSPDAIACSYFNTNITYARLRRDAEICAANLRAQGVKPGDRVGVMLPNLPQTLVAFWGVLKAGGVVVMFNPLYMEKEISHQVLDAGLKHMILFDACWPKFARIREQLNIDRYFITTVAEGLSFPLNLVLRFKTMRDKQSVSVPFDGKHVLPFSALIKGRERLSHPVDKPRETLALLQYTGGTTGLPKGAMLTHYNVASNIKQMGEYVGFLRKEGFQTFMAVLPFFHVYGLNTCLVMPTFFHSRVVPITRFVPLELLASMEKYNATVLPGAPAMYISLLQQKSKAKTSLKNLKICISGSAPMPVEMMHQFEEAFGTRIMEGYGLSEASPITHMTPARGLRKPGSIGLPLPDTEARIVDMELGTVPLGPGKVGELIVRGPQVMSGYWNKPDETAGTLRNGWLYTGDIASMDEDGYFSIVDRKKDMVIVAGYNVSPREIDEVLYAHPKVRDAVSVGVSHPSRGEVIKAYIVLREGESCERAEIVAWCRDRLANYKVPRMVEFRDELPKTLVGKILRRVLRAEEEAKQRDPLAEHEHEPCFDHELHEDPLHASPAVSAAEQAPATSEQEENGEGAREEKSA
jgi:long-chain acyl-CoA synthetase